MKSNYRYQLLFLIVILFCTPALALELKPYKIQYESTVRGFNIKTVQQLNKSEDTFKLTQKISVMMAGTVETSTFQVTSDNKVIPESYIYNRNIFGHNTKRVTHFFAKTKTATYQEENNQARGIKLEDDVYDPLSAFILLQIQLLEQKSSTTLNSVKILEKKRIRKISYKILATEWIETPLGYMETLKVERLRSKKDKHTTIWLAKNWDYVVVKIVHEEPDEPTYQMNIVKGTLNNKKITGSKELPTHTYTELR